MEAGDVLLPQGLGMALVDQDFRNLGGWQRPPGPGRPGWVVSPLPLPLDYPARDRNAYVAIFGSGHFSKVVRSSPVLNWCRYSLHPLHPLVGP
ncbi:MAG TPA: hypothetical protein VFA32_24220, partial [Dehalococcoidia bacterium]|nr:hypothetical protein [Dehalococcoidia bacterium]